MKNKKNIQRKNYIYYIYFRFIFFILNYIINKNLEFSY